MSLAGSNETSVVSDPHGFQDDTYDDDIDGAMSGAERDLAEDAQWKRIQQNTFTRWANERLKTVNKSIGNLETDLSDGLRLITLIEVLSGKNLPKHNKRPVFRSQKLENVSVALKFLQDEESIRIVNIDSSDIVDCKLKLILGLIWTLILHYSISMPMWEGEEILENGDKGATPKQRLLHWIQSKISDLPIGNFTTDWNDGKAVGALVDAVAPGLCPDWQDWNPKDSLQNAKEAMGLADDWLNVRQLIKPEELVSPNMDELSMMTYLSQYPSAKLKPGAPLRPRRNPNRVRAYGPGIEPRGLVAGARADFTVETISAGKGQVDVTVTNPNGQQEPVDIRFNKDRNLTYSVSYTPKLEGNYKVTVRFAGRDIPKSPYNVTVEGRAGDPSKVRAFGPGLNPDGNMINRRTYFDISTKDDEKGIPEVIILDPSGSKHSVPVESCRISPDLWRCDYMPTSVGLHSINIFFAGQHIPNSPFGVRVSPASDPKKVRATGRGLQPAGVRVRDVADFKIFTDGAGEGTPEVRVIGPGGINEPVKIRKIDGTTYEVTYNPRKEGRHVVMVTFAGQEIPRSPFEVNVGPYKDTKIRAYGPGLAGGVVGYPASFTVETNGETGALGFSIEGPSQAKIECHDNGDGSAEVRYFPTAAGEYAVHILCDNEDIPKSPYMAQILPHTDYYPDKVECSGPGIEPIGVTAGKPTQFKIDSRRAGNAPLDVQVLDGNSNNIDVSLANNRDGTYTCNYTPKKGSKHIVQVNYGGVATKNSPYRVSVSDPVNVNKVRIYGPAVDKGAKANVPTHFNVDCREAGEGDIQVSLTNDKRMELPVRVSDLGDGSYVADFVPNQTGTYFLNLSYGGIPVPQCPMKISVSPTVDVSKVKIEGLEKTAPINSLQQFRVVTQGAGKADFAIAITSPSGNRVKAHIVPTHEGYLVNLTPTELGEYLLKISFGGETLSPHSFICTQGSDPNKVRATGPGLERGISQKPAEFLIDTRGAGQGGLGVTVEGPCEAAINCRDNGDGTCSMAYLPTEPGDYTINITFNEEHIPGSPFQAVIISEVDVKRIKVSGNGIQFHGLHVDVPTDFVVDSRAIPNREDGKITCKITNPSGNRTENFVTALGDGTYKIKYTPYEEGRHTIDILYDGTPVSGSPFVVNVKRQCSPKKCRAFGPGLEKGIVKKPNEFTVDIKGAGSGGLDLLVEGPYEAKVTCKNNQDCTCTVQYIPFGPGDYDVSIKFSNQHIPGSPFSVPVVMDVDADAIKAYGPGLEPSKCRSGVPVSFTVDASESAKGTLGVTINTDRGPLPQKPDVQDNGDGTYTVSYVPPAEGTNLEAHVTYDDRDIPNSPFNLKVRPQVEPDKVKLEGRGISSKGVPASFPAEFTIDASDAGYGDLQVQVVGPDGYPRKVKLVNKGDGIFKAVYTPDDCGKYKINVKYEGKEVPHSPAFVEAVAAGRAEKCRITEGIQRNLTSGEEYCITVNTENAGYGALTCTIRSTSGSDLDIDIEDNGDKTFSIYYTVKDAGEYTISIKFGGELVPGGCYTFSAEPEDSIKSSQVKESHATKKSASQVTSSSTTTSTTSSTTSKKQFRQIELHNIPLPSTGGLVTAEVKMPSGNADKPLIEDNRDGTVSIKYGPREEGLHELHIKYGGEHVQGSPFKFHVDCLSSGYVTAYGPGLSHGVAGEPSNFTISTKGAGSGGLTMAVEGPSKAEIGCHDNKDGTVSVSYLPTAPGEYKISVKFGDKHIKGSPYSAKITGEGRKRNQISVGSCSEVSLPGKVSDSEIRTLNASIQAPSGLEEPCFLKRLPNGNLGVSFTPREVGEHQVSVKKMGKHITNSPFKIKVADKEVGDAKKVKVSGALKDGVTHKDNIFTVDTRNAGYGGLSLSIEGPSKAEIACKDNEDGTLNIAYKPTEPGFYIVNLKFADHHVEGSPFTVKVTGEGSNRVREKIQRQREAVPVTEVGSQCKLTFKMPGITSFDLSSTVTSPGGVTEDAEINEIEDGLYAVRFIPKELGVHTVCVKYKDIHIPGSPFQFTVGPLKDGGAHRVHAGGPGLERGEQGQPCEFNVWTREAGAGSLAISVEGPSKAQIDFKDRKDGSCYVSYVVGEPGEYRIGIKFNDQHIPDSPYKVYISPAMGDAHKLEVAQFPENGVRADHPSSFLVRKNGAKGALDCKIVSPSGVEDDCFIQSIDPDTYSVRFMPRENGIHNIHCKFNGVHIPGSPFRIKVGKEDADPAAVRAFGNGLKEIKTGAKTDFIVDTCNAGAGTLAVTVDGPSKVSMDCTEVEEGYKVRYTPLVPGDYYVSVKYNGYHIVGSPFKVSCIGEDLAERGAQETSSVVVETVHKVAKGGKQAPVLPLFKSDASKVTSKGMGLKKAYLQKQNMFTVHCGDAGNNILYVGVYGPKGPCDEVFIKHLGRNNYQVNYVVRDRGDYIVIVRWGDDHIPGSPFKVDVTCPEREVSMVTLKNTGGVELDKESVMTNMYNCEVPQTEGVKPESGGHAKAVLIPGKSSHPFQERTLTLDQAVKIGRSVARTRPSATNGIFDCKVLSRNHAIIWYDNKKFYIQDTKSSNGTFVNNHRLSKGSEDSVPREICSGDVVQFGVDVLENQRKGNGDSKNSDESNRIVTHGCIVATVKLYYPNGKEADSGQSAIVPKSDMPQEEICKLQMIIYEAQQREARLHDKLEELQFIVGKLEVSCQDALTNRFEETRLLSKIENLEKQTQVMRKIRQGSIDKTSEKAEMEIHQLLLDVEKVQCASREIQEMQHRKLLETEQKLAEAQNAASNLQLEVFALREHASRSETHIQELAAKCTSFTQTIELLKTNLSAQMEANQDLEARLAEIQQREAEFRNNFYQKSELMKLGSEKGRLITEECEDDDSPKKAGNNDIVLEWIYKYYTESGDYDLKDRINEDDRTEYLKKLISSLRDALCSGLQNISTCLGQLDATRLEFEKSRDDVERYISQKEELMSQLETNRRFRLNKKKVEKVQNELYSEKNEIGKPVILAATPLEKISELENELKEQEEYSYMLECCLQFYKCMGALAKELLNEARQKKNESERKYNKLKGELDSAKFKFEMLSQESNCLKQIIENNVDVRKFDSEKEKFAMSDDEKKSSETQGSKDVTTDNKECQTVSVILKTAKTNTTSQNRESDSETLEDELKIVEELNGSSGKDAENDAKVEVRLSSANEEMAGTEIENSFSNTMAERAEEATVSEDSGNSAVNTPGFAMEISSNNIGIWEKMERVQSLSNSSSLSDIQIKEIRSLLNLIAEDLVRLLMHEQQTNKDKQSLEEQLNKSMSQADIAALGLANQFLALMVGIFLYYVGERAFEFLGFAR